MDFRLIYFKPETGLAKENIDNYNSNICECVRQLHFSIDTEKSVDMTLFINGFPLVIMELKNQYT
jgi:type I restriction enzyme R subunit